jgi:photosystem II stability/assembly factor-like uncharacterized protein
VLIVLTVSLFSEESFVVGTKNYFPKFTDLQFVESNPKCGLNIAASGLCFISTDGGDVWDGAQIGKNYWIRCRSKDSVMFAHALKTGNSDTLIIYSTDGGYSYSADEVSVTSNIYDVNLFSFPVTYIIGDNATIYKSESDFKNWSEYAKYEGQAGDVCFDNVGNLWVADYDGSLNKSTDNGLTWVKEEWLSKESVRRVFVKKNYLIVDMLSMDSVYYSADFGKTFNSLYNSKNDVIIDMEFLNNGSKWVANYNSAGYTYLRTDDGEKWEVLEMPIDVSTAEMRMTFKNDEYGYLFGGMNNYGIIIIYRNKTGKFEIVADESTVSVFPNPAENVLTVKSIFDSISGYSIYDMQGNEIVNREERLSNFNLDINDLVSGNYHLVINVNGKYFSKQIVVYK